MKAKSAKCYKTWPKTDREEGQGENYVMFFKNDGRNLKKNHDVI